MEVGSSVDVDVGAAPVATRALALRAESADVAGESTPVDTAHECAAADLSTVAPVVTAALLSATASTAEMSPSIEALPCIGSGAPVDNVFVAVAIVDTAQVCTVDLPPETPVDMVA